MVEMSDELFRDIQREMVREEAECKTVADLERQLHKWELDRQLAEYQVDVFDMLDEAMNREVT